MSREVRRVPLDFDFPIGKTWTGYLRRMETSMSERTDEFEVTVPAGIQTRLPNGQYMIFGGTMTGNFTVRGFLSDQGPVVEVIGYQNAGGSTIGIMTGELD